MQNIGSYIVGALVLLGLFLTYRARGIAGLKSLAFYFVVQAEKWLGSKTGLLKKEWAVAQIYQKIPPLLRFFISKEMIEKWVQDGFELMKKQLEEKEANLLSLDQEAYKESYQEYLKSVDAGK